MKYAIDKIEEKIAVLENINNGIKVEVLLNDLPSNIKEGNILVYKNNKYTLDKKEELIRRNRIKSKFAMLRKK